MYLQERIDTWDPNIFSSKNEIQKWKIVKGGCTPGFLWSNGGIVKTRPLEAPPNDPNCPKSTSDALARCPQPLPSTHTCFSFFRAGCWGWRDRHGRGDLRIPPFYHMLGVYAPVKLQKLCITPAWPSIPPTWPKSYHLWQPEKQIQTHVHVTV